MDHCQRSQWITEWWSY